MKILELFGGIGACTKALERLGIDYEIADYVEIDKYAVKSFNAMHNTNFEPQDICNWDKNIEVDLIMHGSPCQDFSLAGKQAGGDEGSGTRSSLMYETIRIVEKLKPKYVIWENVKNVISKKHRHNFDNYLSKMEELGYKNYWQVLNAKDYGIPQNRERVFTVSILKNKIIYDDYNSNIRKDQSTIGTLTTNCGSSTIRNGWKIIEINSKFEFPPKQELKLKLKDMLEDEVDEKYYLSDKMIKYISARGTANFRNPDCKINLDIARPLTTDQNKRAGTTNYLSGDLPSNCDLNDVVRKYGIFDIDNSKHQAGSVYDKNATKKGYLEAMEGDSINLQRPTSKRFKKMWEEFDKNNILNEGLNIYSYDGYNNKINKSDVIGTVVPQNSRWGITNGWKIVKVNMNNLRIRKLTPKECWRLMGFDDEDFEKAEKVNSNTQLYKQAGNSIVVNVLEAIFKNLFIDELIGE